MEESKLDKILTMTACIEERVNNIVIRQEDSAKSIKNLFSEVNNIKSDIRSIREGEAFIIKEQSKRIDSVENRVTGFENTKKNNINRILEIVIQIFIGLAILYLGTKISQNGININTVEHGTSNR